MMGVALDFHMTHFWRDKVNQSRIMPPFFDFSKSITAFSDYKSSSQFPLSWQGTAKCKLNNSHSYGRATMAYLHWHTCMEMIHLCGWAK
jgi:hypothetical protein